MLMSKKRWEEEKEKNANYGGWVEEEGEKWRYKRRRYRRNGWRRRKSEKEEQENLLPEKSHLTRNTLNKKATWNVYLLFMTPLYSQIALSPICTGEMMAGKTSLAGATEPATEETELGGRAQDPLTFQ